MSVTINGNGTITGYTPPVADGSITTAKLASGAITGSVMPAGTIIQTVTSTIGASSTAGKAITSSTSSAPTWLDTDCKIAITPTFNNSKILITWTAGLRLDPSSSGFCGPYYSPNSDMSSPTVVELSKGTLAESYRVNGNGSLDHEFYSWSRGCYDLTVSNTNTRYYNVGAWENSGNMQYGDNQVALYLMAQEIKV